MSDPSFYAAALPANVARPLRPILPPPAAEVETMEEATIRIARKLEDHRWDLSSLDPSERAILARP